MAITKLNSLAIPPDTVVESDISFPLDSASFTGDLTVDTDTLVVDSTNDRVGIGESNPSYLLDLKGGTNDSIRLNALSGRFIFANGSGTDKGSLSMSGGNMDIAADAGIDFYSGGSPLSGDPQVTIDSAGLLGIGEPSPSRKLHVNAGSVQVTSIFESTSSNAFIDFANSATSEGRTRIGCEGADTLTFRTATAERLRISATGVLTITDSTGGNTNLEIYSSGTSGFLKCRRGVTTEIELGAADITFDSGGSPIMTMKNGGNVGIGETNPTTGNLVVATGSRTLGGTITARTSFQGSGWVFGDVIGRFAFDADDGPQDYTGTIESVVSQGGNYPYKTDIIFTTQTNGNRTEKLRIQENGGISFNGDSAAANALDDYEEGTWNPTVWAQDGTTVLTSGVDYSVQTAAYTKIGNLVHVIYRIRDLRSTKDSLISTIPFASAYNDYSVGVAIPYTTTYGAAEIFMFSGGTKVMFRYNLANQQYKYGTFTYLTAS